MSAGQIFLSLFVSLSLTLAAETVFVAAVKKNLSDVLLSVLANFATNPLVNVLHMIFVLALGLPKIPVIAVLEISAVCAEGLLYRTCSKNFTRPLLFSILANGISFSLGLVFNVIFQQ